MTTTTTQKAQETTGRQSKMKVEPTFNEDGSTSFLLTFSNGETRTYDIKPSDTLFNRFAAHGAEQKLRDRIAGVKEVGECVKEIDELLTQLGNNEWSSRREGTGDTGGLLVKALVALSGKTLEEVQAGVATLDKKQQAALRADPTIAAKIEELRPAKAAPKGVDVDALKAALGFAIVGQEKAKESKKGSKAAS